MPKKYDLSTISSGVAYLNQGYVEYIEAVISGRALPELYDGLKPVNRRILYTMRKNKIFKYRKSAKVDGSVMDLHPHGTPAIYQAMVPMTQSNGSYAFPVLDGFGYWGAVYTDEDAAADRYTEVRLHDNSEEFFGEMDGVDMVPNYDATEMEPLLLPVSFPNVLVNSSSGIAVGFSCNIPSFNFNEVCDLVCEYIKDGECHTVLTPDFVTGGYYIKNNKELTKLMRTGKAKLKLRAKTIIDGKKIIVTELPFGRTIQKLQNQINDLNESCIRNAYDTDDYDGVGITIECSAKNRVNEAMYILYKNTDLQYSYSANITVIDDGIPVTLGVWDVIARWVKKRREILKREFAKRIKDHENATREATAFVNLVNAYDRKMELVRIIADQGRDAGRKYIRENYTREEVPEDLIDFCASRGIQSYHTGGKYLNTYNSAKALLEELKHDYENVDEVIVRKMQELKAVYGSKIPRRTEVSLKDYEFVEDESKKEKFIDSSLCTYEIKGGFIRKMRYGSADDSIEWTVSGTASDTLIMFDNRGRLLRLYGQDISYNGVDDTGTYLPLYFGYEEDDDYKITYAGILDGRELMLIYKDGNVGFVNTQDWMDNRRNVRVLQKGISVTAAPLLGAVIPFEEAKDMLFVLDEMGRVSWSYVRDIKHKDRTAKTRVFDLVGKTPLRSYVFKDVNTGTIFLNNVGAYKNKLRYLDNIDDFRGNPEEFISLRDI